MPSSVLTQPLSPTTSFPSQCSEPEDMEGVEDFSVIPAGNSLASIHETNGLAAPKGPSSQIQQVFSSSDNKRRHANGYVASNNVMKTISNDLIRIQTSGRFSYSSQGGAMVDQTCGVKHNTCALPRSRIPCKLFFEKGICRFEDDRQFSHMNQGP